MKRYSKSLRLLAALALMLAALSGCESTGGGGNVSTSVYYGVGFYDPWYYGGYGDVDVIVTPPDRPARPEGAPRPEHPIARPPVERPPEAAPRSSSTPTARPTPSIPSTPRAMPRGGGGRR